MIRPLRVRHLRMFAALALIVPGLLVAALAVRGPVPTDPGAAGSPGRDPYRPAGATRRVADGVELAGLAVRLDSSLFESRPDVLAYWSAQQPASGKAWHGWAHLLGSESDSREGFLPLPAQAAETDGWLVLYSLAHGEVVVELQLPTSGHGA